MECLLESSRLIKFSFGVGLSLSQASPFLSLSQVTGFFQGNHSECEAFESQQVLRLLGMKQPPTRTVAAAPLVDHGDEIFDFLKI